LAQPVTANSATESIGMTPMDGCTDASRLPHPARVIQGTPQASVVNS